MPSTAESVIDGLSTSVAVKAPVVAVSTLNLTLAGEQTVGGVACVTGDRVLVRMQSDSTENGIYEVSTGQWQRTLDFDGNRDFVDGTLVTRAGGSSTMYRVGVTGDPVVGTSVITFDAVVSITSRTDLDSLVSQHPQGTNVVLGTGAFDDDSMVGTVGYRCTAIGVLSMAGNSASVTAGGSNTAVGYSTLRLNVEGSGNTCVGGFSLDVLTGVASAHNNAFGYQSLVALTAGTQNNVFGFQGAFSLATGNNNHVYGENALRTATGASGNHFFGFQAAYNRTGSDGHGFGYQVLWNETSAAGNSAFGYKAGFFVVAQGGNSFFGYNCAASSEPGVNNSCFGYESGKALNRSGGADAEYNAFFGYWSGLACTTGASNAFFGQQSGRNVTTGDENVCIGPNTGFSITTSNRSVYVGSASGNNVSGANNTGVGFNAGSTGSAQAYTNATSVGNGATPNGSNVITLGDASVATLRCQQTTITALSDERYKTNILDFNPDTAMRLIRGVRIVTHGWDNTKYLLDADGKMAIDEDGEDFPHGVHAGVTAQQLDAVATRCGVEWLGLVDKTNPYRWEATPGKLLFPLITSHQELFGLHEDLDARFGVLRSEVDELKAANDELRARVAALEKRAA